jgi:hypothetical protein
MTTVHRSQASSEDDKQRVLLTRCASKSLKTERYQHLVRGFPGERHPGFELDLRCVAPGKRDGWKTVLKTPLGTGLCRVDVSVTRYNLCLDAPVAVQA